MSAPTHPPPRPFEELLPGNAQWAQEYAEANPGFFQASAGSQAPNTLWIGCADSRVPESVVTGSKPGDIFVHRNIANRLPLDDDNAASVLAFSVDFLHVEHVVIVGHTSCGGAKACLAAAQKSQGAPIVTVDTLPPNAPLNRWLAPVTEIAISLKLSIDDPTAVNTLVEANVKRQVENLSRSQTILNAWAEGRNVKVHGWVYDLGSGKLKDLGLTKSCTSD